VIVGVGEDVRHEGLDVPPEPPVYVSYVQRPSTAFAVLIESRRAPADLRTTVQDAVGRTDPTRPVPLLFETRASETRLGHAVAAP
jgi:hypothetical protein